MNNKVTHKHHCAVSPVVHFVWFMLSLFVRAWLSSPFLNMLRVKRHWLMWSKLHLSSIQFNIQTSTVLLLLLVMIKGIYIFLHHTFIHNHCAGQIVHQQTQPIQKCQNTIFLVSQLAAAKILNVALVQANKPQLPSQYCWCKLSPFNNQITLLPVARQLGCPDFSL